MWGPAFSHQPWDAIGQDSMLYAFYAFLGLSDNLGLMEAAHIIRPGRYRPGRSAHCLAAN